MGSAATFCFQTVAERHRRGFASVHLRPEGCSGRSVMDGVTASTDLPAPTLDTLPIEVVQQILSVAASTTTAGLSLTNRRTVPDRIKRDR